MKKHLLIFVIIAALFSCNDKAQTAKVKCYKMPNTATVDNNDWIYYYILFGNNGNYYYYTSPNYYATMPSDAIWSSSATTPLPSETFNSINTEQPFAEMQEPMTELPNEIEVEMEAESSQGTESESPTGNESSTETSSDAGSSSSDAGSSDSGGGDSGGGGGGE